MGTSHHIIDTSHLHGIRTEALKMAVLQRPSATVVPLPISKDIADKSVSTPDLVQSLESKSNRSFEDRVACAMIVRELRRRVEAGEEGVGVHWYSWARDNIKLGRSRLKEHMRVAMAKNQRAEVERLISLALARAQRLEDKRAAEGDLAKVARDSLKAFAHNAPLEKVLKINELRNKLYR